MGAPLRAIGRGFLLSPPVGLQRRLAPHLGAVASYAEAMPRGADDLPSDPVIVLLNPTKR